jgi:hypothetical protein
MARTRTDFVSLCLCREGEPMKTLRKANNRKTRRCIPERQGELVALRTRFDGRKILLPRRAAGLPSGEVIVLFAGGAGRTEADAAWLKLQDERFARVWENDEDAAYDAL